jgi:hypothetical protein
VGMFDELWPSGTDWDLFLRLSRVASFGYINLALAVQRRTSDATHQKFREQDKRFLLSILSREKATLAHDQEALRTVNRGISDQYNALGWSYLEAGDRKRARSTYFQAFKDTLEPMMLMKALSTVVPAGVRNMMRSIFNGRSRKLVA